MRRCVRQGRRWMIMNNGVINAVNCERSNYFIESINDKEKYFVQSCLRWMGGWCINWCWGRHRRHRRRRRRRLAEVFHPSCGESTAVFFGQFLTVRGVCLLRHLNIPKRRWTRPERRWTERRMFCRFGRAYQSELIVLPRM